ncbi:MAG: polysaccharide deacetylase family protein [Candidatus Omnitrophica bacterium]|nr:polysaccharide deacetylase family protein [Candidatus Omnitrophota bacterium]
MKKIFSITAILFCIIFGSFYLYLYCNYEVPILMYHSIDSSKVNSYAAVSRDNFQSQMDFIKQNRYNVISFYDYCRMLKENLPIPRKSVIITFDDGYKDNLKAIKVLKEHDFPAVFFIIFDKIGRQGYLSAEDISNFIEIPGLEIGSHTLSEAYLPEIGEEQLKQEIFDSKEKLEDKFNRKIRIFSYTSGGFNEKAISLVKDADYYCACTTNRGFDRKLQPYALRRIKITDNDNGFTLWAKLSGFYNIFKKPKSPF